MRCVHVPVLAHHAPGTVCATWPVRSAHATLAGLVSIATPLTALASQTVKDAETVYLSRIPPFVRAVIAVGWALAALFHV